MRLPHPHLQDSKDSSCTSKLWLPSPGQQTTVVKQQVAFLCVPDLQLPLHRPTKLRPSCGGSGASAQPADHHGSKCRQRKSALSPDQRLEFTLLQTECVPRNSSHRRVRRSSSLRFASLLAAPAQRTRKSDQLSSRDETAAVIALRDGASLLLAPTGQVWNLNICPDSQECKQSHGLPNGVICEHRRRVGTPAANDRYTSVSRGRSVCSRHSSRLSCRC